MAAQRFPPGPPGRWLSGHVRDYAQDPLGFVTFCAHKYGDVVGIRLGPRRAYLVTHPDLVEQVLVADNRHYVKDFTLKLYRPILGNGLLMSDGDFWLRQRRLIQPAFLRHRVQAHGPAMVQFATHLLDSWREGQVLDIHTAMMALTLEIAAKAFFGAEVASEAHQVGESLETALACIDHRFSGNFWWIPDWVPTANNRRMRSAIRRLDAIIYRFIEERRKQTGEHADLLSLLLHARAEDNSTMTDLQLRDEAMTLFLAGHETTALALTWTWLLLGQHPGVAADLEAELQHVLGGRLPGVEDVPQLRVAEAIIQEAMRLYPPAYGMGRQATAPTKLGNFDVPAGTTLFMYQWVIHRDARYYEAPEEFRPRRWLEGLAQRLPRYAYFPFGGGPRLCIGNTFAMMEAILILATMAQRVRLSLEPGQTIALWPSITLRPRHEILMRVQKRLDSAATGRSQSDQAPARIHAPSAAPQA